MDISKEILEAEKGFRLWEELYKKIEFTNRDRIVCFPEGENELTKEVLKQLNDYIEKKYLQRIVLVINQNHTIDISKFNLVGKIIIHRMNDDEMKCLVRFLRIVNLMDKVIVVSDKQPFGNLNMIGVKGITLQQYVAGTYLWRTNASND